MERGTLIVGRVKGMEGKFIMLLVSTEKGHILESSDDLTEDELRTALAENYGESKAQIEARLKLAKDHPET